MTHLCFAAALLAGCGAEEPAGTGDVAITTWGEGYIEEEIPASDFEDGWSIKFSKFLVVLGGVRIADDTGAIGAELKTTKIVDHVAPGVKPLVTFEDLEAKPWTNVSFEVRPAGGDTELGDGATAADLDAMKQSKYAIWAEGEATQGAVKKTFRWGFGVPTAYTECKGEKDGRETVGVLITNGGIDNVELTIHGDHLFYDDLQSPNAKLRFNALASADTDNDGEVTLAELAAKKLVDIDPADGAYGTGAAGDVNDLGAFVTDLSRTVGHFRGEGECIATDPK
ncbi:hypothetical protein KEG38_17925 [Polyangium jinanense]|uniref:Uncharacterized protein n=2 Tax=Polyangium jinanense TaxID=2829994 RepID=A0A9X3XCB1_9BACT|nr:hypothetical protein [Polyangium jinanense]MDC3986695.1 hypothetical protein [Polyangium jinanense]